MTTLIDIIGVHGAIILNFFLILICVFFIFWNWQVGEDNSKEIERLKKEIKK